MQIRFICVCCDAPTSGRSIPSSTHFTVFELACCANIGGGDWQYGDGEWFIGFSGDIVRKLPVPVAARSKA